MNITAHILQNEIDIKAGVYNNAPIRPVTLAEFIRHYGNPETYAERTLRKPTQQEISWYQQSNF